MRPQTILTIPATEADDMFLAFERMGLGGVAVCSAGEYRTEWRLELLHHSTMHTHDLDQAVKKIGQSGLRPVIILYGFHGPSQKEVARCLSVFDRAGVQRGAVVHIMRVDSLVLAYGWFKDVDRLLPVDVVSLPGAGMPKLSVSPMWPLSDVKGDVDSATGGSGATEHGDEQWLSGLNRSAGILGEGNVRRGEAVLRKIAASQVAIVGCGRMGYAVAEHLVKYSVGRRARLYLIDGDVIERANLDAMSLPPFMVGWPKAVAVASMLRFFDPEVNIFPIAGSISDVTAAQAVIESEFAFSCVDNDAARVGVEIITRRFNRIHFALTGGAAYTRSGDAAVGGEIKLSICGSRGCAACGVELKEALQQLGRTEGQERESRLSSDWLRERPGSSKAVVSSVAGAGVQLFLQLFQEKVRSSMWLHFDGNGIKPDWQDWTGRMWSGNCIACSRGGLGGRADWSDTDER